LVPKVCWPILHLLVVVTGKVATGLALYDATAETMMTRMIIIVVHHKVLRKGCWRMLKVSLLNLLEVFYVFPILDQIDHDQQHACTFGVYFLHTPSPFLKWMVVVVAAATAIKWNKYASQKV
jgi:hypothetical protein